VLQSILYERLLYERLLYGRLLHERLYSATRRASRTRTNPAARWTHFLVRRAPQGTRVREAT